MDHAVFISYASENATEARALCDALESAGIGCWIAPRDMAAGREYAGQILAAISAADLMLVVLSAAANASPHVRREVERAVSQGLPLLPVRIEKIRPAASLEYFLAATQWFDVFDRELAPRLPALVDTVRELVSGESGTPEGRGTVGKVVPEPPESAPVVPAPLVVQAGSPFVGRQLELAVLQRAWAEAREGRRRVVAVAGEPGIGKTRLLAELARQISQPPPRADDDACRPLTPIAMFGRAEEDLGVPYGPFVEALQGHVQTTGSAQLSAELGPLGAELTRLIPSLSAKLPRLGAPLRAEPETERFRLLAAVAEAVSGIARTHPTLLVLDDLHWATSADVLMLIHLVRTVPDAALLVVVAYRDTEVAAGHPLEALLAELPRLTGSERLHLTGLAAEAVGELVTEATDRPLDDRARQLAESLRTQTAGNPFFISELLHDLAERGESGSLETKRVPEGVRAVVARRLSRLPERSEEVLSAAAVIGERFDLPLLLAVTGDDEATLDVLGAAEAAALMVSDPSRAAGYRFAHALVQATLYDRLSSPRRLSLHRKIAQALEQLTGGQDRLVELARHFTAAAPLGTAAQGIAYNHRAGDAARDTLAFEQAAQHYQEALDLLDQQAADSPALHGDLQTSLGDVLHRAGDPRYREILFAAAATAREAHDPSRLALAALAVKLAGEFPPEGSLDEEYVALLEEALAGSEHIAPALRARLLALLASERMYSPGHQAAAQEGVALARSLNEPATLARVLISAHWGAATATNLAERLAMAAELVTLGKRLHDLEVECWGELFRFEDLLVSVDVDAAEAALSRAEQLAERLHQPVLSWEALYRRASLALLAGHLEEAEKLIYAAFELGASSGGAPERAVVGDFAVQLARLRYEQGRGAETLELVDTALVEQPLFALTWHASAAMLCLESDDVARARVHFEQSAATDFTQMVGDDAIWHEGLAVAAWVASSLGDLPRAQTLYGRLLPYAGLVNYVRLYVELPYDFDLGVLATVLRRHDDAEKHLAASEDLCTRLRAPTFLARTHLQQARLCHERGAAGDDKRARDLAGSVAIDAERLGMARVAEEARHLLTVLSAPEQARTAGSGAP